MWEYDPLEGADQKPVEGVVPSPEYREYLRCLRQVIGLPEGREVVCNLLERLQVLGPVWDEKNAKMFKAVVLRDFGQEILVDLALADDEAHDDVQRQLRLRRKLVIVPE